MSKIDFKHTIAAVEKVRDLIIKASKTNLQKQKKDVSGTLSESIQPIETQVVDGVVETGIKMLQYGEYVDKGVSGIKKKYKTPYKYTNKMPPSRALDKWVVRKGIAPRDEKGRFLKRKSVLFLIARGIYRNGMKPSLFLTKPFEKYKKLLADEINEAFNKDAQEYIETELNKK